MVSSVVNKFSLCLGEMASLFFVMMFLCCFIVCVREKIVPCENVIFFVKMFLFLCGGEMFTSCWRVEK